MAMKTKATAKKLADKYSVEYGLTIEVDSETVTVWRDGSSDLHATVAAAIAAFLNAPSVTNDGFKSIVWYKRAPKLDLENVL